MEKTSFLPIELVSPTDTHLQAKHRAVKLALADHHNVYGTLSDPIAGNVVCKIVNVETVSVLDPYCDDVLERFRFQEFKNGRCYLRYTLAHVENLRVSCNPVKV